jgi:GH25 family lysozyme M1 (1,4-beta-N-acetylmuramidase)
MTFDEHWQKVRNANPKLADDHFARALAEAAWEAATKAEREACCRAIDAIDDGEAPEYRACQEAIMACSNG